MSDDKVISLGGAKSRKEAKEQAKAAAEQAKKEQNMPVIYCSFCQRPNTQVVKMVKGPDVNICSECTMIAVQYLILEDKMPTGEAQKILNMFWDNL